MKRTLIGLVLFALLAPAMGASRTVIRVGADPTGGACTEGSSRVLIHETTGRVYVCEDSVYRARRADDFVILADVSTDGVGSSGDPWVWTSTEWNAIKGGPIRVTEGYYEVDHGDGFELTSNTRIHCDPGAIFTFPDGAKDSARAPFKVTNNATGVEIVDCTFQAAHEFRTTDSWVTATPYENTIAGPTWLDIGAADEAGQAQVLIRGNDFGEAYNGLGVGTLIWVHVGLIDSRFEDNLFRYTMDGGIKAANGSATQSYEFTRVYFVGNRFRYFDGWTYVDDGGPRPALQLADFTDADPTNPTVYDTLIVDRNTWENTDRMASLTFEGNHFTFRGNWAGSIGADHFLYMKPTPGSAFERYGVHISDNTCGDIDQFDGDSGTWNCGYVVYDTQAGYIGGNSSQAGIRTDFGLVRLEDSRGITIAGNQQLGDDDETNPGDTSVGSLGLAINNSHSVSILGNHLNAQYGIELKGTNTNIRIIGNAISSWDAAILAATDSTPSCSGCYFAYNVLTDVADPTAAEWSPIDWDTGTGDPPLSFGNVVYADAAPWSSWNNAAIYQGIGFGSLESNAYSEATGVLTFLANSSLDESLAVTLPADVPSIDEALIVTSAGASDWRGVPFDVTQDHSDLLHSQSDSGDATNPTNVNDYDADYAELLHSTSTGTKAHDWLYSGIGEATQDTQLEIRVYSPNGGNWDSFECDAEILYCASPACTPTTSLFTIADGTEAQRWTESNPKDIVLFLDDVDPDDVEVRAEMTCNTSGFPVSKSIRIPWILLNNSDMVLEVKRSAELQLDRIEIDDTFGWEWAAGAPSGTCTNGSIHSDTSAGKLYVCEATSWVAK